MHSIAAARIQELVLVLSQTNHRDTLTLRQEIVTLLCQAVPFDAWCWTLTDPDSQLCPQVQATARPPPILGVCCTSRRQTYSTS
jgi:hypothetical protein